MKESTMLSIMAFLAALFVLASSAFADCSLCGKEADWSRSANEFIEWDPLGDEPAAFGLKEAAGPSTPAEEVTLAVHEEDDMARRNKPGAGAVRRVSDQPPREAH